MSFDKLNKAELLRTLEEDFAFPLTEEEKATKATILAAIAEGQLKFGDYLAANPDQKEKFAPTEVVENFVPPVAEPAPSVEVHGVMVQNPAPVSEAPWLIKMERQNPLYEIGPYKWTQEHPFTLVAVKDVQRVLAEVGGGFRQAYPDEADQFYNRA